MRNSKNGEVEKLYRVLGIENTNRTIRNTINLGTLNNELNSNFSSFGNKLNGSWNNTVVTFNKWA